LNQLYPDECEYLKDDKEKLKLFTCLNEGHKPTENFNFFMFNDDIKRKILRNDISVGLQ
jgi:hypothetical protein